MNTKSNGVLRELVEGPPEDSLAAARERFAGLAEEAGLIDVAYSIEDSPFGPILLAATELGLVMVSLPGYEPDSALERLALQVSPRVVEAPARLDEARRELDLYFSGRLREFDLPLDWQLSTGFRRRVLRATARIPYGETRSYTEMARSAGNERAQRAAGSALGSNPIPIVVPCHRVLRSGGALGGYGGGLAMKEALLELEGVR
ncbi:MAG: methylated-DNA--[protein]-cysteine S-methyltransferase [Solirubrobacterales bacterium]